MGDVSHKHSLEENEHGCYESLQNKRFCQDVSEPSSQSENSVENVTEDSVQDDPTFTKATEEDVGITEYISSVPGFYAVMKERYSDFLVNEIDLVGNVVRLANMEKPADLHVDNNINDLLEEEIIQKLQSLIDGKTCSEVTIEVTDKDKSWRKEIHQSLRQNFRGIESSTVEKDSKKFIIVKKQDSKMKGRRFQPPSGGNYLHFVMYKENRDTMDAINTISSFLRIHSKIFSYAGTKDKRAKTSQMVSAYRLSPQKLLSINKKYNMIKVGNIIYKNHHIKLGDLMGNAFVIILRQLEGKLELVEKAMDSLAAKGFINYYGMQRFGTSSVSTHSIGRSLLLGDWKQAINLILKPRCSEGDENLATSRKIWMETNDAKKAFENLRKRTSIEGKLLGGIAANNQNDLVNALNAIPRNTRLLYIHSYQSFIWNQVVSKRIKKYGLEVLTGDLISKQADGFEEDAVDAEVPESDRKLDSTNIRYASEDDIKNLTIEDVLLPLPGHSILYPNNETKEYYETLLKEDGMSWNNFESKVKTYSLRGAYRKIIIKPKDVRWEIISYDDVSKPLALSDLDVLQGFALEKSQTDGTSKALKIEFKLPSSSYATMAIREVLKCNTCFYNKKIELQ